MLDWLGNGNYNGAAMKKWLILILILSLITSTAFSSKQGVKKMHIISSAFKDQEFIPMKYSCAGEGINPPLSFVNVPNKTKSLTLILEDPDAPRGTFDHWIVFNIPNETKEIKEGTLPSGANFGSNSIGKTDYVSPCPPPGKIHHYVFSLFALDSLLPLKDGTNKQTIKEAMKSHILAEAKLTGLFKR